MKRVLNGVVAPFFVFWWIFLVSPTLRITRCGNGDTERHAREHPHVSVFWHSRIFYMTWHLAWRGFDALVSPSSDGDIIANTLRLFGFHCVRGSSFKRGPRALLEMARRLGKGASVAMIADGSRGPALKAQSGAIYLAKLTGHKIAPIAWGAKWKGNIGSWDRTIFPLPFSPVRLVYGDLIEVSRDADNDTVEQKRAELERELLRITAVADDFGQ